MGEEKKMKVTRRHITFADRLYEIDERIIGKRAELDSLLAKRSEMVEAERARVDAARKALEDAIK